MAQQVSGPSGSQEQPVEVQTIARYDFIVDLNWREFPEIDESTLFQPIGNAIEDEFGSQVQSIFEGMVTVRITRLRTGSIIGTVLLVLASGVTVYEFLSKYKDFYDSLVLLRQHLRSILDKTVRPRIPRSILNVALTQVPVQVPYQSRVERPEPPPLYSKVFLVSVRHEPRTNSNYRCPGISGSRCCILQSAVISLIHKAANTRTPATPSLPLPFTAFRVGTSSPWLFGIGGWHSRMWTSFRVARRAWSAYCSVWRHSFAVHMSSRAIRGIPKKARWRNAEPETSTLC